MPPVDEVAEALEEITEVADPSPETDPEPPAPAAAAAAEPAGEPPAAVAKPVEEQFIDPSTLPPELKAHWTRMHGTYNKKLAEIRPRQQDIALVDRYRTDPEFARQFLMEESRRFGLNLAAPNGADKPATAAAPQQGGELPQDMLDAIKADLGPELDWLAPKIAAATVRAHRHLNAPREQQDLARQKAERIAQYNEAATKLAAAAPGWEAHEPDMSEMLSFLQSPALTHDRFGSKLELLHRMVRPDNGQARVQAIRSMGEAVKNAARTGQPGRSTTTNLPDRVRQAPNNRAAIEIAAAAAEDWMRANGQAVPD